MVSRIHAWEAADGKLFSDEEQALKHDAVLILAELKVFNHASALAVVDAADDVLRALKPLVEYQKNQPLTLGDD